MTVTTDDYVTVTTVLRMVRDAAILVDRGRNDRERVWIPRSVLFGPDDRRIESQAIDAEFKVRVRRWKADELGLVPDKNTPAQRNLEL
ncbi:MAG: hypothetical protein KDK07_21945 [Bauldia sp.]|nr:hypothetical protein [Bauldia sp.]